MPTRPMTPLTKIIFWFVSFNALLGALSLILFPSETDRLFFWKIAPPINAALFGALYLGGAIVVAWMAYQGNWENARFLIPILVSAGIFITITTFLHLEKFTAGIKLAYWLVVYIGAPILAAFLYIDYERKGASWEVHAPLKPATRLIAGITGGIILLAGLFLLTSPESAVDQWAWPISPLMLRIFAAWFSAFGVGLLWFWVEQDWQRLSYIPKLMIAASVLDLCMLFLHREDVTATDSRIWIYVFHLVALGLIGVLTHWLQKS